MEFATFDDFYVYATSILQKAVDICAGEDYDFSIADGVCLQLDTVKRICVNIASNTAIETHPELDDLLQELDVQIHNVKLLLDEPEVAPQQPELGKIGTNGRPMIDVPVDQLRHLVESGASNADIASCIGISVRTVKNRLAKEGLRKKDRITIIDDQELENEIRQASSTYANIGYRQMHAHLLAKGIVTYRERVRECLKRMDLYGVARRTIRLIPRRKYNVRRPNDLWHMDGNLKLGRYGFCVHGCIDGYSRMLVYLEVSTNNKASTVFDCFLKATRAYGLPSRMRADRGGENLLVGEYMERYCGTGRGSFLVGRSVHNQRIERFWLNLRLAVLDRFIQMFRAMEYDGILDISNTKHILILRHVFLSRLRTKVSEYMNTWNCHGIRTEHYRSPNQIWQTGTYTVGLGGFDVPAEEMIDGMYGVDPDAETHETCEVEDVRELPVFDHPEEQALLDLYLDSTFEDGSFGVNLFVQGKELLGV